MSLSTGTSGSNCYRLRGLDPSLSQTKEFFSWKEASQDNNYHFRTQGQRLNFTANLYRQVYLRAAINTLTSNDHFPTTKVYFEIRLPPTIYINFCCASQFRANFL